MPVLVIRTSKFDEGPIKNEHASLETPFSHYKSMGNFFRRSRGSILLWRECSGVLFWREWSDLAEIQTCPRFYACPCYCKFKKIKSKLKVLAWRHCFPHYKPIGACCCHGNQFWSDLPQMLMHPFPHPSDAAHKIWSRLATSLRDIQVWNREWTDNGQTDHWYIISSPCEPLV